MSSSSRKILFITLSVLLILFLIFYKIFFLTPETPKGAGRQGPVAARVPVQVVVLKPTTIEDKISATGTVLADEEVLVRSEVAGRITRINFKEGTTVKKGQVLVTINADEIQAELTKLRENQRLYRDMEQRQRTLLEKEYISKQEYDEANNRFRTASADIQAAQATLAKSTIRAPFSGLVGLRNVSEGSYISPNTPITTILDIRSVKIDLSIPGRYSQSVKTGDEITFMVEGNPETYTATVYAIEPKIDPVTRTLQVRARYQNKNNEVLPGAFVNASVSLQKIENAVLIPSEAVIPEATGHSVFVAKGGKAMRQPIKIGIRSEATIQVTEGLQPGDTLISSGILQVRPGSDIDIRQVN
jgi:membrane fusion protein, multidrug efflux system